MLKSREDSRQTRLDLKGFNLFCYNRSVKRNRQQIANGQVISKQHTPFHTTTILPFLPLMIFGHSLFHRWHFRRKFRENAFFNYSPNFQVKKRPFFNLTSSFKSYIFSVIVKMAITFIAFYFWWIMPQSWTFPPRVPLLLYFLHSFLNFKSGNSWMH